MKSLFTLAALVAFMLCSVSAVTAAPQEASAKKCDKCPASAAATATVSTQEKCTACPASAAATATVSTQEKCTACPASSQVATTSTEEKTACCDNGPCQTCTISTAMAKLPKMTYKVGEESTCCSESAGALAKKANAPIHFVVGEKVFEEKEKAYVSLVESTESMVNDFMTPKTCEKSGTTTIAGEACACSCMAGKKAELVKAAAAKVQVSYKVGEETCACPTHAGELAKKSGEKMTYVVAGEETCCSMTARLNTARAKYKAAVEALAAAPKAEAKTEATTEVQGG